MPPENSASLCRDLGDCVEAVAQRVSSSRLQLNVGKTEFMWCVSPRRRHLLPADPLMVQSAAVAPLLSVRDLTSAYISTMTCQCTRHAAGSFVLRRSTSLRRVRRSLNSTFSIDEFSHLVHYFKGGLLQCCSGRSTTMRPGPMSSMQLLVSRLIQPSDAASKAATLATSTATSSIQVVCTRASLSERHSAEIHD